MRLGVHLPLAHPVDGEAPARDLLTYAREARDLGFELARAAAPWA